MSKIALCHFRVGETDGVSLEMAKWRRVLEGMGHEVVYIAGNAGVADTIVIPELHYADEFNIKLTANAFDRISDYADEIELREAIDVASGSIGRQVRRAIERHDIDVLVPNNLWSLGWNLPAGLGFMEAVESTGKRAVAHHHDFHWERPAYIHPTCRFVRDVLDLAFPPRIAEVRHAVISSLARESLLDRTGLAATIVPNVFDFDAPVWEIDGENHDLREAFGIAEDDICVLQATRVVERKGIEMGHRTGRSPAASGASGEAARRRAVRRAGVERAHRPAAGRHGGMRDGLSGGAEGAGRAAGRDHDLRRRQGLRRARLVDGGKVYSLWDCYAHADLITYPSLLEGWGNQLLEALFARRPIVLFEYPVFSADLLPHGFEVASLGSETAGRDSDGLVLAKPERLDQAAETAIRYLTDGTHREEVVEANFERGAAVVRIAGPGAASVLTDCRIA